MPFVALIFIVSTPLRERALDAMSSAKQARVLQIEASHFDPDESVEPGGPSDSVRHDVETFVVPAAWPVGLLRSKLKAVETTLSFEGQRLPALRFRNGVTIAFDGKTGLPLVVDDRVTVTQFHGWRGGVPRAFTVRRGGQLVLSADVHDVAARAKKVAHEPKARDRWSSFSIAPLLWRFSDDVHELYVFEAADHLIIGDAPGNAKAALAAIKKRFPHKPPRTLVLSHHHPSATAGLRDFARVVHEIIVAETAREWVAARVRTPVTGVSDSLVVDNGLKVAALGAHPHASSLLVVWAQKSSFFWMPHAALPTSHPLALEWTARLAATRRLLSGARTAEPTNALDVSGLSLLGANPQ